MQLHNQLIIETAGQFLSEAKEQDLYMIGCIGQADIINGNGRRYALSVMQEAVQDYIDTWVKTDTALGELNHPARPYADPKEATHRITEMWMDGSKVMAKAIVLEDATKLRALIKSGWKIQASTRGLGSLESRSIMEGKIGNSLISFKVIQE